MNVLTEEHRMLQESLNGILSVSAEPEEVWRRLAESGMLGMTLPEGAGGAALGLPELMLFVRTLGAACASTPFFAAEVLAMPMLAAFASQDGVATLLPKLAGGQCIATLALDELEPVVAREAHQDGILLTGVKARVPAGAVADVALLGATFHGAPALFLLNLREPGVTRVPYFPAGSASGADIVLADVAVPRTALLAEGKSAASMMEAAEARGQLATCARMLGEMERLLDLTVDYLRERQQFGQPIASFQVLQHAAVDMYVELETARAMFEYASRMFRAPTEERARALDAAKLKMNSAAKSIGESAVQLHGAIGMTMECVTGRLFASLTAGRLSFGDSRTCVNRLIAGDASIALT